MRKRIPTVALGFLIAYVIILLTIRMFESRIIFFPDVPDRLEGDWSPKGFPVQDTWLQTSDGVKLHAWWVASEGAKFTFLAFHGNASNIANRADIYKFLHTLPANVLAVEYRGYGRSEGNPSEKGVYRDAEAGLEYLVKTRGTDPRNIISYGQSLGSAVAAHLAVEHPVGGVVLEAPFPSLSAMARRVFPFFPGAGVLVWRQFDTERALASIHTPVLVVHCTHDAVIPPEMEEAVFSAARPPKSILRVNGYCHEEASLVGPAEYQDQLRTFLQGIEASPDLHVAPKR